MTEPRRQPERIDLARVDDPRDAVHRAVACLAQGGIVALPTETHYALAASGLEPDAVERLANLTANRPEEVEARPLILSPRSPEEVADWVPGISSLGLKLARRVWPGPVTLVFRGDIASGLATGLDERARRRVADNGSIGLHLPNHDLVLAILRLISGPLVLTENRIGGRPSPSAVQPLLDVNGLDMILDDGPVQLEEPNTVAEIEASSWKILRSGAVPEATLARLAGTIVLFVCTGNTCRSPMAEALCKHLLATRLGCPSEDLEAQGFVVLSAGIAARGGARAAGEAVEVIQARGGSLRGHASQQITPELIEQADWIVTMTRDHRDALLDYHPEAADRVRLLDPSGGDLADPYGSDRETYRRTAEQIEFFLQALVAELLA